MTELNVMV